MLFLLQYFLISLGINGLFFIFAMTMKTDVFTDITYSLTYILMTIIAFLLSGGEFTVFRIVTAAMVIVWALRLGSYLFFRILRIKVDHRFDNRRDSIIRFGSFWLLQTFTVFVVMIPILVLLEHKGPVPVAITAVGWSIWGLGFLIEVISDAQKFSFKSKPENDKRWISSGLWKFSRHPNFFGEALLWLGISLPGLVLFQGIEYLSFIGPVFITFLLVRVSGIPLLEKSAEKKYGNLDEYREYVRKTSLFILLPPKR